MAKSVTTPCGTCSRLGVSGVETRSRVVRIDERKGTDHAAVGGRRLSRDHWFVFHAHDHRRLLTPYEALTAA